MSPNRAFITWVFLGGCGQDAPTRERETTERTAAAAGAPAAAREPAIGAPAPAMAAWVRGPTLEERCTIEGAMLAAERFDEVDPIWKSQCGAFVPRASETDWPGVTDFDGCGTYDDYRNAIYAWYGYPFTKPELKARYASEPWYRADPAFDEHRLSATAQGNVQLLLDKAKSCKD
jgi:hypothetical protein